MSPRQLIIKLLERLENKNAYADLLLEHEFKKHNLSDPNRALVQEIFFGVIRLRNRLNWIIKSYFKGNFKKSPRFIQYILQSSLYQLHLMDKIPEYAAINEAVELAKSKGGAYWGKKVNAILRSYQRTNGSIDYPDRATDPVKYISVYYSHPEWLVERWINRWGIEETIALCEANNKNPAMSLRVNHLRISTLNLKNVLSKLDVQTTQSVYLDNFLMTERLPNLAEFKPFQDGLFTIQDTSAGLACRLLAPEPGDTIIDLCAAPGGKTSFLAELTGDRAKIFSIDLNRSRLRLIAKTIDRLQLQSVQLIQADGTQFSSQKVDKVIVDAPCSGLGVLSRRVDLRWKRTPKQIQELSCLQFKLLRNAAALIQPGGTLVYSTCTIEPEENEYIIEKFLQDHQEFQIDPASKYVHEELTTPDGFIYTFPHRNNMDGSFAVRLIKA